MAEAIGLVASAIAIAEASIKLSQALFQISETVIAARKELEALASELVLFASVLESIGDALEAGQGLHSGEMLRTAEQVFHRCGTEFEEIRNEINLPIGRSIATWDRLRWTFQKPKAERLKASLECSKTALMLMLQTLCLATSLQGLRCV